MKQATGMALRFGFLLSVLASAATAQDGPSVSGNLTLTSDYVFRGISQTNEGAAAQGDLQLTVGGFYTGMWGSNVDFGSTAHAELDFYLGFTKEYDSSFRWDLGALLYLYPGDSILDTLEVYAGVGFKGLGLKVYSTNEYFGLDTNAVYAELSYELSLPADFGLTFRVGQSTFDQDDIMADYIDYSVGVSKDALGLEFALTFFATDIDNSPQADDRLTFSISKSL